MLRIFFGRYFTSLQEMNFSEIDFMNFTDYSMETINSLFSFIVTFAKILFWGLMAPFFYIFSYFKLSEKEVRDGF